MKKHTLLLVWYYTPTKWGRQRGISPQSYCKYGEDIHYTIANLHWKMKPAWGAEAFTNCKPNFSSDSSRQHRFYNWLLFLVSDSRDKYEQTAVRNMVYTKIRVN